MSFNPDPDEILSRIRESESNKQKGKLKIFFGMCAGVGKTYSMLQEAGNLIDKGKEVIIGCIETHGRIETEKLTHKFKILARKKVSYKEKLFEEFDIDKALELKPEYILIDELAHTNIPGSKHSKRYQDVLELLDAGINVFTTLNVQHIESRSEIVETISGIRILETVPDSMIEIADEIELIDIPIDELLLRLSEGKVYIAENAKIAFENFFRQGNLISLREMALRLTAEKVETDLMNYMSEQNIPGPWKAGNKLLVAVGSSPFSAELIKWTRRMAFSLKAPWFAVYVKTKKVINDKEISSLEKNLRLAKELGAEVITTASSDLVDGILEIARRKNISQIIIGKPARYNLLNYLKKDNYIDRLIHESGNIDIYIVRPDEIKHKKIKKNSIIKLNTPLKHFIYSLLSVIILAGICFPFKESIGYQSVGLILLFNVLLLPFFFERGPIIAAAILNALIWNFFFIPPLFTFEIGKLHDLLTLMLNIVVAVTTGILATKLKTQKLLVQIRESNSYAVLNLTKELSEARNKYSVISIAMNHINKNFEVNATFFNDKFEPIISSGDLFEFNPKEITIVKWAFNNNRISGKFTENLPDSVGQYFPVITNRMKIGVVCLLLLRRLSIEEENLLNNILAQMATFYEKEESNIKIRDLIIADESKKLYDTLIDSITHEFRTPIAVISGASSGLLEDEITSNPKNVKDLACEIYEASDRINMLVENLLDINRLDNGKIYLNKSIQSINGIIIESLELIEKQKGTRSIKLFLDETNPDISIDSGLIKQAIFNILHNACIYTPESTIITVKTTKLQNEILIEITDNGNGLPEDTLNRIFDKFYRFHNAVTGGTGLGLSISKGFIEAHKGSISVKNNYPHGLVFTIILPNER